MAQRYLTQAQVSNARRRLTRAVNAGDHRKIIDVVNATFDEWDRGGYAYPDDWARWERARDDAILRVRLNIRIPW